MNAHRRVSPLDGLREALGGANVTHAVGCGNDRFLPALGTRVHIEYRRPGQDEVVATEERDGAEVMWFGLPEGVPGDFLASLTSTVTVTAAGLYDLSLISAGLSRLHLDGKTLIDNWDTFAPGSTYFGFGSDEVRARTFLTAGEHVVTAEFTPKAVENGIAAVSALRIGFQQPLPEGSIEEAAALAAEAEVAVVCIGTNGDWETEGVDRWGLTLPGQQDELVRAVARANPNTVVLLQTGGPVLMPWLGDVAGVLQAWFPGQEAGHAVADVLLGRADPGGRLPQTFPTRLEDDPVHPGTPDRQYPGENGHVEYQEGLYIGYRHVDRHALTPLFPFGFGLSYTTFALGAPHLSATVLQPGEPLTVTVPVRNVGARSGQTVVQLYVQDVETTAERPEKELKAFAKAALGPGEAGEVTLTIDMRAFAYFDDARAAWVADAGDFNLLIGQSSADLPVRTTVHLAREWSNPLHTA